MEYCIYSRLVVAMGSTLVMSYVDTCKGGSISSIVKTDTNIHLYLVFHIQYY